MSDKIRINDVFKGNFLYVLSDLRGWKIPEIKKELKYLLPKQEGFDSEFAKQMMRLRSLKMIESTDYRWYITNKGLRAFSEWAFERDKVQDGTPRMLL